MHIKFKFLIILDSLEKYYFIIDFIILFLKNV